MGARDFDADIGNRDGGDHDVTEVLPVIPNVWHPSFGKAAIPKNEGGDLELGRRYLEQLKEATRPGNKARAARPLVNLTCWRDTPQLYRRMVVAAAGLPPEVVNKIDRDLSESEKVRMRAAISDMRVVFGRLTAL